jgi:hypothetical protein
MALDTTDGSIEYYIDIETGKIYFFIYDEDISEYTGITLDNIKNNPDRYIYIEPISSHEKYRMMEDFIESIKDKAAKEFLENALQMRKPFRNFKDALFDYPKIREQWFQYEKDRMEQITKEWLKDKDIDAEFI